MILLGQNSSRLGERRVDGGILQVLLRSHLELLEKPPIDALGPGIHGLQIGRRLPLEVEVGPPLVLDEVLVVHLGTALLVAALVFGGRREPLGLAAAGATGLAVAAFVGLVRRIVLVPAFGGGRGSRPIPRVVDGAPSHNQLDRRGPIVLVLGLEREAFPQRELGRIVPALGVDRLGPLERHAAVQIASLDARAHARFLRALLLRGLLLGLVLEDVLIVAELLLHAVVDLLPGPPRAAGADGFLRHCGSQDWVLYYSEVGGK